MDPFTFNVLLAVAGIDAVLWLGLRLTRAIRNSPERRMSRHAKQARKEIDRSSKIYMREARKQLRKQTRRK